LKFAIYGLKIESGRERERERWNRKSDLINRLSKNSSWPDEFLRLYSSYRNMSAALKVLVYISNEGDEIRDNRVEPCIIKIRIGKRRRGR
jgi:hypothetical protein